MIAACIAGLRYYAIIFGFAFAMGMARTLVIAPRIGATSAVLLEVPIVVAVSWIAARRLLRHRSFVVRQRAAMGATAFILTMASEIALAGWLRGQSGLEWLAEIATPLGLFGLSGQIAFGLIPVLVPARRHTLQS